MGQYYIIVNVDKHQMIKPHKFGDGLKLMEFANSQFGTLTGMAVLLADGNNRGGGDLRTDNRIVGSWAGDRIVVAGDYADPGKHLEHVDGDLLWEAAEAFEMDEDDLTLFQVAQETFDDVSNIVIRAIADGEGERHPLAHLDLDEEGWRSRPSLDDIEA